ncbi:U1 small nuclear ribonucleoprotein A-like isoform X1 [Glycine soja]|uniref:U1 small nuclear ribonucleoprotein A-like isoform X1 n=1 Tax=Glycine soja TaxID=3848 RepID=UPI00103EB239|nr:U1 small nuclear ribonucleoprotein A-like isoform X1 [Glycine soja]
MDDMAAYYSQPQPSDLLSYQYYQPPPPPPPPPPPLMAVVPPPPGAVVQPAHHVHPSYMAQHQAVFASYGVSQSSTHEVRTLFVAGLPEDVKPREIYNLFREFPDYESSHLRSPSNSSQPFAFAVFASQQSAIMAKHALNGLVFDLEKGSTLYIDLAKSNSRSKRTRIDDERAGADKKARGLTPSWATPDSALAGVGSIHMPGMGNPAFNTNMFGYPSAQSLGNADGSTMSGGLFANLKKSSTPYVPQNSTPCATLFVANLGSSCNEQELIQVFSRYPGFLKLKMQSTYGAPVAFVDFQDVGSSTDALNSLQGTILHSSQSGEGMRVEYAKSRMGMRKKPNR